MEDQFTYQDFDLLVEPAAAGSYRARVLRSPAGEAAPAEFMLPFSPEELGKFVDRVSRPRRRARGPGRPESAPLKDFGGKLYDAVFQHQLRDVLQRSLSLTRAQGIGMRLRLRLVDVPELAELPWEFLYDPRHDRFLAQSRHSPLVRYLDLPDPPQPLSVEGPLRLLVMISSPSDYPELNVEREWELLTGALARQQAEGRVVIERLAANMNELRQRLRRRQFHVFHFVGHGRYRHDWGNGVLVMEDRRGRSHEVPGDELGSLLNEYHETRLAVLNACEGARSDDAGDPFAGMAQSLIRQGLPAVVAMQFEITDDAAIIFAQELYGAIADGYPLEAALAEARGAIRDEGNLTEWGTPVLYSRAPDGRLFSVTKQAGEDTGRGTRELGVVPTRQAQASPKAIDDPAYVDGLSALHTGRLDEAVNNFTALQTRFPNDSLVQEYLRKALARRDCASWWKRGVSAAEQGDWDQAVAAFERMPLADASYPDAAERLRHARREQRRNRLIDDVRRLHAARQWEATIAAGLELAKFDPTTPDPDGLITQAREVLAEEALASRYATGLQQFDREDWPAALATFTGIEHDRPGYRDTLALLTQLQQRQLVMELQRQLHEHAEIGNWVAVLSCSDQLAGLDAGAADPDGLATQARKVLLLAQMRDLLKRRQQQLQIAELNVRRKAQQEAERKAQQAAERRQRAAERKAQQEAERKAQQEAERKARQAAERRQRAAERKAQQEAERKAQQEAERKAQQEAERKPRQSAHPLPSAENASGYSPLTSQLLRYQPDRIVRSKRTGKRQETREPWLVHADERRLRELAEQKGINIPSLLETDVFSALAALLPRANEVLVTMAETTVAKGIPSDLVVSGRARSAISGGLLVATDHRLVFAAMRYRPQTSDSAALGSIWPISTYEIPYDRIRQVTGHQEFLTTKIGWLRREHIPTYRLSLEPKFGNNMEFSFTGSQVKNANEILAIVTAYLTN